MAPVKLVDRIDWEPLGGNFGPRVVSTSALELVTPVLGRDRLIPVAQRLIPQRLGVSSQLAGFREAEQLFADLG